MARLSIQLPEDLRSKVEARASEVGHASVEDYIEALLRADLDAGPELGDDDDIEAMLLERVNAAEPPIEVTPEFVEQFKRRQEERRQRSAGGQP